MESLFFEAWPTEAQLGFISFLVFVGAVLFSRLGGRAIDVFGGVLKTTVSDIPKSIDRQSEALTKLDGSIQRSNERDIDNAKYIAALQDGQVQIVREIARLAESQGRTLSAIDTKSDTLIASSDASLKRMTSLDSHVDELRQRIVEARDAAAESRDNSAKLQDGVVALVRQIEDTKTAMNAIQHSLDETVRREFAKQGQQHAEFVKAMTERLSQHEALLKNLLQDIEPHLKSLLVLAQSPSTAPQGGEASEDAAASNRVTSTEVKETAQ